MLCILGEQGFAADAASSVAKGFGQVMTGRYDLLLVDLDELASQVVAELEAVREAGCGVPILVLGSHEPARTVVVVLRAGADDFLAKPFDVEELVARVHANVRRAAARDVVRIGDLELDRVHAIARYRGVELILVDKAFEVLVHLATWKGTVSRRELMKRVWPAGDPSKVSNILRVMISHLRQSLGEGRWMIETVHGVGYRLVATRTPPAADVSHPSSPPSHLQ